MIRLSRCERGGFVISFFFLCFWFGRVRFSDCINNTFWRSAIGFLKGRVFPCSMNDYRGHGVFPMFSCYAILLR